MLKDQWCDPSEDEDDIKNTFYVDMEWLFNQLPVHDMKILFGYFKSKVGREAIFHQQVGTKVSIQKIMIMLLDLVNFATSNNPIVKSTKFLYHNIHKCTWTLPDDIDKRRQSSIIDIHSLRGADCVTDHYLVVATIWERGNEAKFDSR